MEVSVIICSRNRSGSLDRTLQSLRETTGLGAREWEVVVVDNDSEDDTRQVVEHHKELSRFPVRYTHERQRGLSFARNRGFMEARGKLIAFTDDDVIVDKAWVGNIVGAFREYDAACIGGKILPIWDKPRPKWLTGNLYGYLALLDYGDTAFSLDKPLIWGANFAVKARALHYYGPFNTRLGRIPGKLYAGEETDFFARLLRGSQKIVYAPKVVVHHCIPEERMKKSYFRRWAYDQGELAGILSGEDHSRKVPVSSSSNIRKLLSSISAFFTALMEMNESCFPRQLELFGILGLLMGMLKCKLVKMNGP